VRVIWNEAVGRQLVEDAWKIFWQHSKQFILCRTRLLGEIVDRVGANGLAQLGRRDRLVLPGADPGVDDVAQAVLLELTQEHVETARALLRGRCGGRRLPTRHRSRL